VTDRPINVLLDASAVVAFTDRDSIAVGEVIAEVDDAGCAFGIPVGCLAVARGQVHDKALLDLLVNHRACRLVDSDPDDWEQLADAFGLVGSLDTAAAAVLATRFDVHILTREPRRYRRLVGGGPVIEV
jgi:hypothetical protein